MKKKIIERKKLCNFRYNLHQIAFLSTSIGFYLKPSTVRDFFCNCNHNSTDLLECMKQFIDLISMSS
jgi:hypothetical protein